MKKIKLLLCMFLVMVPLFLHAQGPTTSTVTTIEEYKSALMDDSVDIVKLGNDISLNISNVGSSNYGAKITAHKTLDLNGHTLTHSDEIELYLYVSVDNATFEITDSVGTGKIDSYGEFLYTYNYEDVPHTNFLLKLHDFDLENIDRGQTAFGILPDIEDATLTVENVDFFYPSNSPLGEGYNVIVKSLTVTPTDYNPVGFFNGKGPELLSEVVHPDSVVYQGSYLIEDWTIPARDVFLGAGSSEKIIIKDHCTISFQTNGGSTIDDINVPKGTTFGSVKPENPTKDGYRFFQWYYDGGLHDYVSNSDLITHDVYLHARYGRFYNAIAYDKDNHMANAGGFIRTDTGYEGTNNGGFILEGEPKFLEQHANPGNLFVGWVFNDPEGTPFSTEDVLNLTYEGEVYGNIYAVFERGIEVSFDTNGGSKIDSVIVRKGTTVGVPADPVKEGYKFGGWFTSNTFDIAYEFSTELSEDTTIYAKWIKIVDTIDISFNEKAMPFVQSKTDTELIDWLRHNTVSNIEGVFVYQNTNTQLYKLNGSTWENYSIHDQELGLEDEYAVMYSLGFDNNLLYDFPDNVKALSFSDQVPIGELDGLKVIVNGVERTDIKVSYNDGWNCIMIVVPLGIPLEKIELVKPTVVLKNDNNKMTITWDEQLAGVKYRLYRSTDNKKWTKLTETTSLSYVDKSLTYGKKYYYKVRVYDEDGKSIYSDVVNRTIKPNKVKLSIKSAGTDNIKLNWEKVGVTGYQIARSTDNKKWTNIKTITKSSTLEYSDKKLSANKTYYYKIRAYKTVSGKKIYGSWSDVVSTKTAPKKPTFEVKLRDYDAMDLVLGSTKGAVNYIIQVSLDGKTYNTMIELPGPGTLEDAHHEVGRVYYYRLKACNSQNRCSGWVYKELKQTPKTPKLSLATSSKKVTVTVGSVNGADGYKVYRATSKSGKYELIKELSSEDELTFTNKTTKGKTYYYKVRSYRVVDGSKVYSPYSGIKNIKSK